MRFVGTVVAEDVGGTVEARLRSPDECAVVFTVFAGLGFRLSSVSFLLVVET